MFERVKFWLILLLVTILVILIMPIQNVKNYIKYEFTKKNELTLNLTLVNPSVRAISADPDNKLVLKVEVRDSSGLPVPKAHIIVSASEGFGLIYPSELRTNQFGEALVTYSPIEYDAKKFPKGYADVTLSAEIFNSYIKSSVKTRLVKTPVVLIHGYLASGSVFENLIEYLSPKGLQCSTFSYNSKKGVAFAASELEKFLQQKKLFYLSEGMQVKKFDIVAHSLGGLIVRYYSCSKAYIKNNDINKIVFVSVPQKGSPLAPLGVKYFNDQSIKDLIPENRLFINILPSMLNNGLNNTIETGSILGQYDEVVGPSSASLEEWNIKTEIFFLGESKITVDSLLSGSLMEAPIHKGILSNKKVFEKIYSMLNGKLPYPLERKR